MDPSTKRQLVGATVLVALAVIFLPMILSSPEETQEVDVPVEVPPREGEASSPEETAGQPSAEGEAPSEPLSEQAPELLDEPTPQPGADEPRREPSDGASEPAADDPAEGQAADQPAADEPAEEPAADEPAADEAAATGRGDGGQQAPSADADGDYAVQVGSFRKQGNAQSLRDRLEGVGLPVYVATGEVGGTTRYRVRLGPTASYSEAEALLERAAEEADLEGFVLAR
mgnify:CR=1 FL=1